jgi:hypothetical protein
MADGFISRKKNFGFINPASENKLRQAGTFGPHTVLIVFGISSRIALQSVSTAFYISVAQRVSASLWVFSQWPLGTAKKVSKNLYAHLPPGLDIIWQFPVRTFTPKQRAHIN